MTTPEQNEAQERLQQAIEHHCRVWTPDEDIPEHGEILVDWAIVMHLASYDDEGDQKAAYRIAYSGGEMPDHRAVGLFEYATHLVKFGARPDGTE